MSDACDQVDNIADVSSKSDVMHIDAEYENTAIGQSRLRLESMNHQMRKGQLCDDYMKRYYRDYRNIEVPQRESSVLSEPISQRHPGFHSYRDEEMAGRSQMHGCKTEDCREKSLGKLDNKSYRLICSIIVGQLSGFILFVWMFYHLNYAFLIAAIVAGAVAMLLGIFLALSRVCRCTAAVLLPSICTTRGRLAFIVVISGFLLGGPVSNVYVNMSEISRSMSCSAEQAYNQTNFLLRPFDAMMRQLNLTIVRLQEAAHNVSRGLRPLDEGLANVEIDLYNGKLQLLGTRKV